MEASASTLLTCLTALSAIGAVAVYPRHYERICGRLPKLPRCLTAVVDESYNPADEARKTFSVFLTLSALCAATAVLLPEIMPIQVLCLLYAGAAPAYFLHRCFCLHKLDTSTPYTVAWHSNALTVHRPWLMAVVWLSVVVSVWSAKFDGLPFEVCNAIPIALSVVALAFTLYDSGYLCRYFKGIREEYRPGFMDFAPYSYYALTTLLGTALTQAAVYTGNVLWLVLWMAAFIAFLFFDYRMRLCDNNGINGCESWDPPRKFEDGEAHRLYRKGLMAMCGNKGPCWLLIVGDGNGANTRAELACDMRLKCTEIILEKGTLLYVCAYPGIPSAFVAFRKVEFDGDMRRRLIASLNPDRRNLVLLPTRELEAMNKCDNPFQLYENEKQDA